MEKIELKFGSDKYSNYKITKKKVEFVEPDDLMNRINGYLDKCRSHEETKSKVVYDKDKGQQVLVEEKYMTKDKPILLSGLATYCKCSVGKIEKLIKEPVDELKRKFEESDGDYEIRKDKFKEIKEILDKFITIQEDYLNVGMLSGEINPKAAVFNLCNKYKEKYQEKSSVDHTSGGEKMSNLVMIPEREV